MVHPIPHVAAWHPWDTSRTPPVVIVLRADSSRSVWDRQRSSSSVYEEEVYGEEEAVAWYFTKAMAASSLQNSSNTITPSSKVM